MALIIGGILVVFGISWSTMMIVIAALGVFSSPGVSIPWYLTALSIAPGILAFIPGVVLVIVGLAKRKKRKLLAEDVFNHGIPARARVSFVDKNYAVLMNEKPIYTIIEFEFTAANGRVYTGRKESVDSDLVIRNQIMVGSEVDIKYLTATPEVNILMLADPRAKQGNIPQAAP